MRLHIPHHFMWLALAALAATSGCDRGKPAAAPSTTNDGRTAAASASTIATASTIAPAAPGAASPTTAQLNPGDLSFLTAVARANEAEISTTELGMSRGNAKNKELSRMLNGDHVALRDEVTALAPTLGTPPTVEAPKELSDLQGEAFDGRLIATYRTQHEEAIRLFTSASTDTTLSESVRLLASDTLPKLKSHLAAVQAAGAAE
jgi:predicted outer membrane protein